MSSNGALHVESVAVGEEQQSKNAAACGTSKVATGRWKVSVSVGFFRALYCHGSFITKSSIAVQIICAVLQSILNE